MKGLYSLPGWSASSAEPYIKTFCALSRSEIFLGNQTVSPKSKLPHLESGVGGGKSLIEMIIKIVTISIISTIV